MPPTKCCSFCQGPLDEGFSIGSRNTLTLVKTLFQAANVKVSAATLNQISFNSCDACYERLLEVSKNFFQLEAQLMQFKGVVLQNLARNKEASLESLGLFVKDLNPSVLIRKSPGIILPKKCKRSTSSSRSLQEEPRQEDNYEDSLSSESPKDSVKQEGIQKGSEKKRKRTKSTSRSLESETNKEDSHEDSSSPKEIRMKKRAEKNRKILPNAYLDENGETLKLISHPYGAYSFNGIMMTPIPRKKSDTTGYSKFKCRKCLKTISGNRGKGTYLLEMHVKCAHMGMPWPGAQRKPHVVCLDENGDTLKLISHRYGAYSFNGVMLNPVFRRNKLEPFKKSFSLKCGACGKIMRRIKHNLELHVKSAHMGMGGSKKASLGLFVRGADGKILSAHGIKLVKTEDNKYKCGSCHEVFAPRSKLLFHIRHTHAKLPYEKKVTGPVIERVANRVKDRTEDRQEITGSGEVLKAKGGTWKCGQCGKHSYKRCTILAHIKKWHPKPNHCTARNCGSACESKDQSVLEDVDAQRQPASEPAENGSSKEMVRRVDMVTLNF